MERDCLDWPCFTGSLEGRLEWDLGGGFGGEMIHIEHPFLLAACGRWLCSAVIMPGSGLQWLCLDVAMRGPTYVSRITQPGRAIKNFC